MSKVWDRLFKKPPPVDDREDWSVSPEAGAYIYLPNLANQKGNDAEDFYSNGTYTRILLGSYQEMCHRMKLNPSVQLANGILVKVKNLTPMDGVQTAVVGERSARLANSTLVDFDDSGLADEFITTLSAYTAADGDSPDMQAKLTVLSKAELMLLGRSVHVSNRLFMQRFFALIDKRKQDLDGWYGARVDEVMASVGMILNYMVEEGMILASPDAEEAFRHRTHALTGGKGDITALYREAGRYD